MKKSTKQRARRSKRSARRGDRPAASTDPVVSDAPIDPMSVLVDTHARITRLVVGLERDADPESFKTIARMSETLVKVSAEARQLAKQKRRDLATFTDNEIVEHVSVLSDARRESIVASLSGEDLSKKPLFG
jgi:hypothetical protein